MSLIGAHINSDLEDLINETNRIKNNGGNIVQLFVNISSEKTKEYYKHFVNLLKSNNMKCVVHASYTINCAKNWTHHSWWIKQFIMEIEYANSVGAIGIVIHMGKQLELSIEESLNNMFSSLLYVHNQTINYKNIKIFIETPTGQGSEICYTLDTMSYFYKKISQHKNEEIKNRFGICLDTCHIFVAGYDIRTKNNINKYFNKFNKLIGIEQIKLIHLNDSKKDIGSHVDRHDNIGDGFIGHKSLLQIVDLFYRLNIPMILETPINKQNDDMRLLSDFVKTIG